MCCREEGGIEIGEGMDVDGQEGGNLEAWLREVVGRKVGFEQRWRGAT